MHRRIFYLFCLIALTMLSGCSTVTKEDIQTSSETLNKGKSSYRVRGKNYHVLSTSKNYKERGIASWYGRGFRTKRTSSGEHYNMQAMTAAHKTLPLTTYVEVTNIHNGKKVIVKVNDRGPFQTNRLIDLSYIAAKKLGMLGQGTVTVDIKAIDSKQIPKEMPLLAENEKPHVKSHHKTSIKHLAQRRSKKIGIKSKKIVV